MLGRILILAFVFAVPAMPASADDGRKAAAERRIDQLIALLGSPNFKEREQAEKDLVALGSNALPRLERALTSGDKEVARRAKTAIAEIMRLLREAQSVSKPRFPDRSELDDPSPYKRLRAISELSHLEPRPKAGLPLFEKAMADADAQVRIIGLVGYTKVAARDAALKKVLALMWDDKETTAVRNAAIHRLQSLKPEAQAAVPDLLQLLRARDAILRSAAALVLGLLGQGSPEVVGALLGALNDESGTVRGNAAGALGELRQEPRRCVPAIHQLLRREMLRREKESHTLISALAGLLRFGPDAKETILTVFALAKDGNVDLVVRIQAVRCLEGIGSAAFEQLDQLATVPDLVVATVAKTALKRMPRPESSQNHP